MAKDFDYLIIGNGLSGLQLALAFSKDSFFDDKKIALIDKSQKNENDKTWCFWEKGNGKWENLVHKSWDTARFFSASKNLELPLSPYRYKMIRSLDFYEFAKGKLHQKPNFYFLMEEVISTNENEEKVIVKTSENKYTTDHIFDSRIPKPYFSKKDNYTRILQHFKGWMIETKTDNFNANEFTVMDFRVKHKNTTSFFYVLPISERKALVEATFFTPFLTEDWVCEKMLNNYISKILKIERYTINETEQGIIPMTDFPFEKFHTENCTKIGTGGGWVKASTGYSFKNTEKKTAKILQNIKAEKNPANGLTNKRFQFYDKIFLNVLNHENEKGEWIFERFYGKNKTPQVFNYLDEETSLIKELKIMGSLRSFAFLRGFFRGFKTFKTRLI